MRQLRLLVLLIFSCPSLSGAQDAWNVKLLCNWNDTTAAPANGRGQRYNDTWGFTVKGVEYAAIGSTQGVHIIDVNHCKQVAFYPGRFTGEVIHRDYKTYKSYLYAVCDQGTSNLQVFDLNYLPDSLHLIYETDPMELMLSHNIFIDTAKATLYFCIPKGTATGADHMRVYSLANPEMPTFITKYNMASAVHDVYVRNDTAYCSSSQYGFEVVDFTAHNDNWQKIAELRFYPFQGYNHSSWINEQGIGVMADETHGMPLKVIDTRNLSHIRTLSTFIPRQDSTCIPHNPYLLGDYVFISYYFDGLQIYDISDPVHPKRIGYYDTYPGPNVRGFAGAWGCYPYLPSGRVLVSDMQTGLYVFDVTDALRKADTSNAQILELFPNPFTESLQAYFPKADTGQVFYTLSDAAGRLLFNHSFELTNYTIQPIQLTLPGNLTAGTYFIRLRTGKHVYKEKITKR